MTAWKGLLMAGIAAASLAGAAAAQVPDDIAKQLVAIGRVVDVAATAKIYTPLQKTMPQPGVKATRDIAYGPGPKEKLDVFTTEAKAPPKPILIFLHGGGFVGGDKGANALGQTGAFYDNIMLWAVGHGMVGVNINYSLAPGAQYPTVQHETAMAVAWARANAASFGGDPNRIVLWGHSAGAAHVGTYVAHPETYADVAGARAPVSAAVMTSGTYELGGAKDHPYYGPAATLAERSSTAGLLKSKVPLFVIHAELDPQFMVDEAHALDAALTKAGRDHQFLTAVRHSHMSESYATNTADESVSGPILAFIQKHTK